jgi:hypothetical protein
MIYIANYKDWIQDSWVEEVLNATGYGRPAEGKVPDSPEEEFEYQRARDAGYKDSEIYFYMFDKSNVSFEIPKPPWIKNNFHWWITKMNPGNFMPMHSDPHSIYEKDSKRYWVPLQDWSPGHVFMYEDEVITDYKFGDVWMYDNSIGLHGAANIGYTPRLVLQISEYVR